MNLMLDFETLGTDPSTVVLSLGAVLFTDKVVHAKRYFKFNVQSQLDAGRTVSADTLAWWINQSEKAREVLTPSMSDISLVTFNDQLTTWLYEHGALIEDTIVWGNGSTFDVSIAENITKDYGLCWDFWNVRCFRTYNEVTDCKQYAIRTGTHHNALDDAMYQTECLLNYWQAQRE